MKKQTIVKIIKTTIQIVFIFLFPFIFTVAFNGLRSIFVAFTSNSPSFIRLFPKIIPVLSIIPFTIIFGRFFCGWMCAFGAVEDFIALFSNKFIKQKFSVGEKADTILKYTKYVVLLCCIVFIWFLNITAVSLLSPWDAFGLLPNVGSSFAEFQIGFLLFIVITLTSFFVERFFCRYLCPLGAVFTLVSKFRILKIAKPTEKCFKCRVCTNNCPMGIPLYKDELVRSSECIDCMNCTLVCPRNNARLQIVGKDLNPLIASTVAVASITGLQLGLGNLQNSLALQANAQSQTSTFDTATSAPNKLYKDGEYLGTAKGYRPNLNVKVTIRNDKIVSIMIEANNEEPGYREEPFSVIPNEIIKAQSTSNIAVVSGATYTSKGVIEAVKDALSKAVLTISESANSEATLSSSEPIVSRSGNTTAVQNATYKDGVYTGVGMGFEGNIGVKVTISSGKISAVLITSQQESKPQNALSVIPSRIVAVNTTNVSVVSGATYSSNGIIDAVNNALSKAIISGTLPSTSVPKSSVTTSSSKTAPSSTTSGAAYKDGTYSGTGMGFEGNIDVNVTISGGKISSVLITSQQESKHQNSLSVIPSRIVAANTANVSVVSGATYSSNGIINAVNNALSKAVINGTGSIAPSSAPVTSSRNHNDDDDDEEDDD